MASRIELNGANFIENDERHGTARSLFWPWAAGNVSFLALSYGSFFLGFGISFWQATFAAIIGTVGSFLLVGISSGATLAAIAWNYAMSRLPVAQVTSSVYLLPPIAFLIAWLWLGESPTLMSIAGTVLALVGILMVQWPALRRAKAA